MDQGSKQTPGAPPSLDSIAAESGDADLGLPKEQPPGTPGHIVPPPLNTKAEWVSPRRVAAEIPGVSSDGLRGASGYADRDAPFRPADRPMARQSPEHIRKAVLPLPFGEEQPSAFSIAWFLLAFVIPVVIGSIYYLFVASDQYVCEFRFSVREPVSAPALVPSLTGSSGSASGLSAMFAASMPANPDTLDNYTVVDYVISEQAARDLQSRIDLSSMYSRRNIDFLSRFGRDRPPEQLAKYWKKMVYSSFDPATGLAIVRLRAFTPSDAYRISTTLLSLSNDVVNNIGLQSQKDSLKYAQQEVANSEQEVAQLESRLTQLRSQRSTVDPLSSTVPGNAALATTLRANMAQTESQIIYLTQQTKNPDSPQIRALQAQLAATKRQLDQVTGEVGHSTNDAALATTAGEFEKANNRLQTAEQLLLTTQTNLLAAQVGVDTSRLYLTTYVKPTMPQSSIYPNRLLSIGLLALVCLMIWLVGLLIANSVIEHAT